MILYDKPHIKALVLQKKFKNLQIVPIKYLQTPLGGTMAQALLKNDFTFTGSNTLNLVETVKNYISKNDCPTMSMDISTLNIIDASKIAIICSTYHWAKYPQGEISWKIGSHEIQDIIKPLNLGNIRLVSAQ